MSRLVIFNCKIWLISAVYTQTLNAAECACSLCYSPFRSSWFCACAILKEFMRRSKCCVFMIIAISIYPREKKTDIPLYSLGCMTLLYK